jgi:RNA polymerase sigma-70 factor (subfamily 1)
MQADSTQDQSDEELLRRIRAGDDEAFESLLARHEPAMRTRCRQLIAQRLNGRVSVSDVLQEARLAAFEGLRQLIPRREGSIGRWLLRVVERKAIDAARAHGTAKRDAAREVGGSERPPGVSSLASPGPSPSEVAIAGELAVVSRMAMAALPEDYREILRLTHVRGLSLREAADCMGRSREAAKKLYGRALARFGELFERYERGHHGP